MPAQQDPRLSASVLEDDHQEDLRSRQGQGSTFETLGCRDNHGQDMREEDAR